MYTRARVGTKETTFGGLTPLFLETSRRATQLIPMAVSLGFGIVFAFSTILVTVPCRSLIPEDVTKQVRAATRSIPTFLRQPCSLRCA
jgi:multidrug efflux pump subunit AcrB